MAVIAVSFCNQIEGGAALLALVDEATHEIRFPELASDEFSSACGLAVDDSYLYCAVARNDPNSCAVVAFDRRSFARAHTIELPGVVDVHSIAADGDHILAVSTGSDRILRFDRGGRSTGIVWSASESERDTHHINSLLRIGDRLLCCAFGPRFGDAWGDAVDGYVYDIAARHVLARGLYQPHSLAFAGGILYLCESGNNVMRTLERPIRYTNGYTRGLAVRANGDFFVGSSVGRASRTSAGLVSNAFDPGELSGACTLEIGNVAAGITGRVDFGGVSREIYDVLLIE